MKKTYILSFLLILSVSNIFSQSGWFWQNPNPVGSHLEDCFFVNDNTGYAVGWDGVIIKTINGGINWFQQNSSGNRFLMSVFFTNENTGYIVSGDEEFPTNNVLFKTTNAGVNWGQIYSFNNSHLSDIYFVNNSTGFIVGGRYWWGGYIFKTTNAGSNWNQYTTLQTNFMNSIFFTSLDTGYIAGDDGKILKTTNTGLNWEFLNVTSNYPLFNSVYFINSRTGFVAGNGGILFKTINAGINWIQINTVVTEDLWDIRFKDSVTGFITVGGTLVEVSGKILKTTNSGNNWESIPIANTQNYRGIAVNNNNIISVGYWGTTIKSTDNGANWNDLSNSMIKNNYNDIYVIDSLRSIVVGDSSKILTTNNAGNTWVSQYLGGNYRLNSIFFINSNTGYIAGGHSVYYPPFITYYYSKIYKSTNGGLSWSLIYGLNNESSELKSVKFINNSTGFCIGNNGILVKTTNSGVNWVTQNLGLNYSFNSICFTNANIGYIAGNNGIIFKSTDLGNSWFQLISGTTSSLSSIMFPSENVGFASSSNKVLKTTDNGLNWNSYDVNVPYEFAIKSISFLNIDVGYAVGVSFPDYGRAGDLVKTTNGGQNWLRMSIFSGYPSYQRRGLNSVHFLNDNYGYIVGEISTILTTSNGGNIIGIQLASSHIPQTFALPQNYPNPFNPVTKIKFDIPNQSVAKIIIYDLLGREVATLVNEQLKPGTYEVDWDGTGFASGVYFYSLVTNDFVETKRMVLIK